MEAQNRSEEWIEREQQLSNAYAANAYLPPLDRLPEKELDTLLLMKHGTAEGKEIAAALNQDFATRYGFTQPVCWDSKALWVKVSDPQEANRLKPRLRELGYTYLETFMGSMSENNERHWVLRGEKSEGYFPDREGYAKEFKELLEKLQLKPVYVYAMVGQIFAEFEITVENLAAIQLFMANSHRHGMRARLVRNATKAIDIVKMVINDDSDAYIEVTVAEMLYQLSISQSE